MQIGVDQARHLRPAQLNIALHCWSRLPNPDLVSRCFRSLSAPFCESSIIFCIKYVAIGWVFATHPFPRSVLWHFPPSVSRAR